MKLFRNGLAKKTFKVRKQSKARPCWKIKRRKKGTWIKLAAKIGPLKVSSIEIGV